MTMETSNTQHTALPTALRACKSGRSLPETIHLGVHLLHGSSDGTWALWYDRPGDTSIRLADLDPADDMGWDETDDVGRAIMDRYNSHKALLGALRDHHASLERVWQEVTAKASPTAIRNALLEAERVLNAHRALLSQLEAE